MTKEIICDHITTSLKARYIYNNVGNATFILCPKCNNALRNKMTKQDLLETNMPRSGNKKVMDLRKLKVDLRKLF